LPLHTEAHLTNRHQQRTTAGVADGCTLLRGRGEGGRVAADYSPTPSDEVVVPKISVTRGRP